MNATDQTSLPTLSIVLPNLNHGRFLEKSIGSIINQDYEKTELIVVDGGSEDESLDIIRRHENHITSWLSEPDHGHYDALNKGFARSSGQVMAWMNSDDCYMPWTFSVVADIFNRFPEIEWLTSLFPQIMDRHDQVVKCNRLSGFNKTGFQRGAHLPEKKRYFRGVVQQEATFWRRSLWQKTGGRVDGNTTIAGDYELWSRFIHHARLYGVTTPLAAFRIHGQQKTSLRMGDYSEEAYRAFERHGGRPCGFLQSVLRHNLQRLTGRMPLRRTLPQPVNKWFCRLGITSAVYQVSWKEDAWRIQTDYVF